MSVSRRLKIHYIYGNSNRCHDVSPLYGGCPLLGESVMRGFTVPHYRTASIPHYRTASIPHYRTTSIPHYRTTSIPHYHTTSILYYADYLNTSLLATYKLLHYWLPNYCTTKLLHYRTTYCTIQHYCITHNICTLATHLLNYHAHNNNP